eukprot:11174503-Lingulodinium_polyedra.AAC.1
MPSKSISVALAMPLSSEECNRHARTRIRRQCPHQRPREYQHHRKSNTANRNYASQERALALAAPVFTYYVKAGVAGIYYLQSQPQQP